jgi:hypothetical protein
MAKIKPCRLDCFNCHTTGFDKDGLCFICEGVGFYDHSSFQNLKFRELDLIGQLRAMNKKLIALMKPAASRKLSKVASRPRIKSLEPVSKGESVFSKLREVVA